MSILKTAIIASELLLPPKPKLWVPAAPAILRQVTREIDAKKQIFLGSMLINPFVMGAGVAPAPLFIGSQAGSNVGINGGTLSVNYALTGGAASVPAAGDFVIINYVRGCVNGSGIPATISGGGAWNNIANGSYRSSSYTFHYRLAYRVMPGTPDTAFQLSGGASTTDGMAWSVQVWRNINVATPQDVTYTSSFFGGGAGDAPAITPVTDGAIIIGFSMAGGNLSGGPSSATGMLGFAGNWANDTYDAASGCAYKVWANPPGGAFDPPSYGGSGSGSSSAGGFTVALRPA